MDWEIVIMAVGIIVTLLLGLLGLRPEWRKMASTSRFTLKRDLEILELIKNIDKDDPRYKTVKKDVDAKIDKMYLPAEQTKKWSILASLLLFVGFSFWSWYLVKDGFTWWVILTGYIAIAGLYLTMVELSEWYIPLRKYIPVKRVSRISAPRLVDNFKRFINDNKGELTALRIIYGKPCNIQYITYNEIEKLAEVMKKPPYRLTPDLIWMAYGIQEKKVPYLGGSRGLLLADILPLIWFTIGKIETLEPFAEIVDHRFDNWMKKQEKTGRKFTSEQKEWLEMIKKHIATSLSINMEDFESVDFYKKGGAKKADNLFAGKLDELLKELNEALVMIP